MIPQNQATVLTSQSPLRYAITDATVPSGPDDHKSIWLCPLFFDGDDTENDLPNTNDEKQLKFGVINQITPNL